MYCGTVVHVTMKSFYFYLFLETPLILYYSIISPTVNAKSQRIDNVVWSNCKPRKLLNCSLTRNTQEFHYLTLSKAKRQIFYNLPGKPSYERKKPAILFILILSNWSPVKLTRGSSTPLKIMTSVQNWRRIRKMKNPEVLTETQIYLCSKQKKAPQLWCDSPFKGTVQRDFLLSSFNDMPWSQQTCLEAVQNFVEYS